MEQLTQGGFMKCLFDGCERDSVSKGYCDMHYRRILKRGDVNDRGSRVVDTGNAIERFHKKYVLKENGCWIWIGGSRKNTKGISYPRHHVEGDIGYGAHRFSYEIHFGKIPEGMYVCHKCDTPMCVNPDHLFVGTHKDNMKDMVQKNRSFHGRGENKKGRAKLTNKQADQIRSMKLSQSKLASMFGVSQTAISRIKRGVSY
jgi:predicted XRE-type DNA-binding protein